MLQNLGPPWGKCSSTDYDYFNSTDRYTMAKCQLECKTRSVYTDCGCKDSYMPGAIDICSLAAYLYCVESPRDQLSCNCPDECLAFSYTTSLSISQLSGVGLANTLLNTDSIRESYWHSLEIANRVDEAQLTQTIYNLKSVIASHRQVKTLIYKNILNPPTSETSLVLKAVKKLMEIVRNDVNSSQLFLDNFQDCYTDDVSFLVQSIADQLSYMSQDILWLVNSHHMTLDQHANLKFELDQMKTTILAANDFLNTFCPLNFNAKKCSSLIVNINNTLTDSLLLMSTENCTSTIDTESPTTSADVDISTIDDDDIFRSISPSSSSASTSLSDTNNSSCVEYSEEERFFLLTQLLLSVQPNVSVFLSCMTEYADELKTFQSFLDSVDPTVSTVDLAGTTRSMNTLLEDAIWLEVLMVAYQNGSVTKLQLSDEFLQESNSRLLLHVENALSGIETSVLSDVTSVINIVETRIISVYTQLIVSLYKLQTFMSYNDTSINDFARELLLWRSPIPMLQDKTMVEYQMNSDQIEQMLGVEMTVSSLVSRSANIVPMLVRAYNAYLKQTLTNVQSELRLAQQAVIGSVNILNQQLTNFNISNLIDDSFVRRNFLEVDIFYGELRYRTIEQTTGYDLVQFLSDFGGCFGLFLGGSILSFFELLDLLIYNLIGKITSRKIRMTKTRINVRPSPEVQNPRSPSGVKVHHLPDYDRSSLESVRIE